MKKFILTLDMKDNFSLRILCILIALCWLCVEMRANQSPERRVYYLDCSYSMITNKIWKKVCDNLVKAIENVDDETTELLIIPFAVDKYHHTTLDHFYQKATRDGKDELIKHINSICPSTQSMTYHSDPLKDFYNNNRVDDNKVTYMFLMTDGANEENPDMFIPELKKWQIKYGKRNVYGFYVMLDTDAHNNEVEKIIDTTDHLWKVETADVNINLIRFEDNCIFNVRNDHYVDIPKSGNTTNVRFKFSTNDPYYNISKFQQEKDFVRLYIHHPNHHESLLPEIDSLRLTIKANNKSSFDFLISNEIYVLCLNKLMKGIRPTFNKGKGIERLGKLRYYPRFLWVQEKKQVITDTLHINFNADAKANNGFAEFEIVDNEGNPIPSNELRVYLGNKELINHKFKVYCNEDEVILTFQYEPTAKSGKHQGWLKLVNHNLDQDGDMELSSTKTNNSVHWQINYEKEMNPLKRSLIFLAILICTIVIFFYVKNNFIRRKIYDKQIFLLPNMQSPIAEINGCIKCVISSSCTTGKNKLLHRLFFGPIQYVYIEPAVERIILTTNYSDELIIHQNSAYIIDEIPLISDRILHMGVKEDFKINNKSFSILIY